MITLKGWEQRRADAGTSLGGAAPPTNTDDASDIIVAGRAAWERRKADARMAWGDYIQIGGALLVGYQQAKRLANGKTSGNRFSMHLHIWLKDNGFADIDKDDRAKLLWIMHHLEEVEAWRETRSEYERAQWNAPNTVWRICHCKQRGLPRFRSAEPESGNGSAKSDNGSCTTPQREQKEKHQTKKNWDPGQLMLAANKAMGLVADLKLKGGWPSPEPPDRSLVVAWWKLAWAITNIASALDTASGLSPENIPLKLRMDLPLDTRINRHLTESVFQTDEEAAERPPLS